MTGGGKAGPGKGGQGKGWQGQQGQGGGKGGQAPQGAWQKGGQGYQPQQRPLQWLPADIAPPPGVEQQPPLAWANYAPQYNWDAPQSSWDVPQAWSGDPWSVGGNAAGGSNPGMDSLNSFALSLGYNTGSEDKKVPEKDDGSNWE